MMYFSIATEQNTLFLTQKYRICSIPSSNSSAYDKKQGSLRFARGDLLDVWASEEVGYGDKQGSNR